MGIKRGPRGPVQTAVQAEVRRGRGGKRGMQRTGEVLVLPVHCVDVRLGIPVLFSQAKVDEEDLFTKKTKKNTQQHAVTQQCVSVGPSDEPNSARGGDRVHAGGGEVLLKTSGGWHPK